MIKPLPTSTASFHDIITGDYLYIDKTQFVYELAKKAKGAYFLSRPRRFGKSLLISTLDELFRCNRELFRDLWIDSSDYEWETYPVIRLDFSQEPVETAEDLKESIRVYLHEIADIYAVDLPDGPYYRQFRNLIQRMAKEKQVVILIDEYDNPLIDNLDNVAEAKRIRSVLKGFYGVIKAMDRHIRTVLITGVSKFSKVGVFSELNNLDDLTFDGRFATMLGITQAELEMYFQDRLPDFAQRENLLVDELLQKIRHWYNGFRFTREEKRLYNPFSTMNLFEKSSFHNYWFESGTPTFLVRLLHRGNHSIEQLTELKLGELAFSTYEIDSLAIIPLLFQTGYLTIKEYEPDYQIYELGYPNYEVENAFLTHLLDTFSNLNQGFSTNYLLRLLNALQKHDLVDFFKVLKVLFANIDYDLHLNYEKYYQTIFYLIFTLLGLRITAEVKTNDGRIDAVVELTDHIYLFEFKLDKSAKEALAQIKAHAYYQKYLLHGKPITCVGANFNTQTRTVDDWTTEAVEQFSTGT